MEHRITQAAFKGFRDEEKKRGMEGGWTKQGKTNKYIPKKCSQEEAQSPTKFKLAAYYTEKGKGPALQQ